ncbi:hypothetical protein CLV58_113161 [Spirosoma oryzae]|uniref:Uncharacterized protein n=1 Tax=Spirosoma oryzae TaxID=1469603 RepID=A0A2T0SRJ8_9BACT|nr:hypothetical protein CLV58_113161 [Spirosoma oryzae]
MANSANYAINATWAIGTFFYRSPMLRLKTLDYDNAHWRENPAVSCVNCV